MSVMAYRPVASVTVLEKGSKKPIRSVRFEPTPDALRRMADHRMVHRTRDSGFQIYAVHDSGGTPRVPIAKPLRMLFSIRAGADFHGRYKPEPGEAAAPALYLTNRDSDGEGNAAGGLSRGEAVAKEDLARIVPRRLRASVPLTGNTPPTKVEVRRRYGGAIVGEAVAIETPAEALVAELAVDLSGEEERAFTLVPLPGGVAQHIFADDALAGGGSIGVLELILRNFPGPQPAAGRVFTATFEPAAPQAPQ
jgi:hypothetical protein